MLMSSTIFACLLGNAENPWMTQDVWCKAILFVYVDFFENLSILRANEIKINGIIPLCIGPQDCRSRASRGGLTLSQPLGQIMLPDYYFPPPGVSDLPAALGRPQLASTIDTSQDESECLRGRRPPQHIDALYQNLVWFQGRPKAALPCLLDWF